MPKHILIAGGSGFIGRTLCQHLLDNDYQVAVLTRHPDHTAAQLPDAVTLLPWDARSCDSAWTHELPNIHAVINLAGEPIGQGRWSDKKMHQIRDSRVLSAQAIANALQQTASLNSPPPAFLQVSGIGYYGDRDDQPLDESSPPGGGFLADVAQQQERAASHAADHTRVCLLRLGVVLDRSGGLLANLESVFKTFPAARIGRRNQYVAWIHLDDVLAAIRFLLDTASLDGPVNLVAPNPTPARQFYADIAHALGKSALLSPPAFLLRALKGQLADELILASQRALPQRLQNAGFAFQHPTLDHALQAIYP